MLQQIFGYLAINQTKIKISSWNFQHLFITSLCKFDKKILAKTQTACLPRPISAETLDVSSDCICWDISKRKKLVRFWTYMSTLIEGIANIFKKMAFWNFSNECSVQVLQDVHDLVCGMIWQIFLSYMDYLMKAGSRFFWNASLNILVWNLILLPWPFFRVNIQMACIKNIQIFGWVLLQTWIFLI